MFVYKIKKHFFFYNFSIKYKFINLIFIYSSNPCTKIDDNDNIEVDVCGDDTSLVSSYDEMLISSPAEACANDLYNVLYNRKFIDSDFVVDDLNVIDSVLRERYFIFMKFLNLFNNLFFIRF